MSLIAVYTTVGNKDAAQRIASEALSRKLVACAQFTEITSMYHWKGEIQHEPEIRLMLKSTEDKYESLRELIVRLHPYELPAVFAVRIDLTDTDYESWVRTSTEN